MFVAEDLSDKARALAVDSVEVWAPAHATAELAEILCRKVVLGEIGEAQCQKSLDAAARLLRTAPLEPLLQRAVSIALELKVSAYDALYVALAEQRQDKLVTWDKRLLRQAVGSRYGALVLPLDPNWKA